MSVLIKGMEKPKSCYAVIDGESEYCPFVNTDDDCVLMLKKGICEGTWEMQYSKCPLVEVQEPCEDDKGCSNCMYGGRPTYKSPCSECHDKSQLEMKPISRSHENGAECDDLDGTAKNTFQMILHILTMTDFTKRIRLSHGCRCQKNIRVNNMLGKVKDSTRTVQTEGQ